jgi:hypothetical protein
MPAALEEGSVCGPIVAHLIEQTSPIAPMYMSDKNVGVVNDGDSVLEAPPEQVEIPGSSGSSAHVESEIETTQAIEELAPERHIGPHPHPECLETDLGGLEHPAFETLPHPALDRLECKLGVRLQLGGQDQPGHSLNVTVCECLSKSARKILINSRVIVDEGDDIARGRAETRIAGSIEARCGFSDHSDIERFGNPARRPICAGVVDHYDLCAHRLQDSDGGQTPLEQLRSIPRADDDGHSRPVQDLGFVDANPGCIGANQSGLVIDQLPG